jgi:hypothetical protein
MNTAAPGVTLETVSERPLMEIHTTTPGDIVSLLRLALEKGQPVEALEKLQALHERVSDRAAAIEFAEALAKFQSTCPPVKKTSTAKIMTDSGVLKYSYNYAELDEIAVTIAPHLQASGLSYTWDSEIADKMLKCTCILRHVNGHKVPAQFSCPIGGSPSMSEQQKYASTLTYARRQSLVQALGLTTTEPDTDGEGDMEPIDEEQAQDLEALIQEVGADKVKFLSWLGVRALTEIPAKNFDATVKARAGGAK